MNEIETFKFRFIIYKFSKVDKCNKFCHKQFSANSYFYSNLQKCFVALNDVTDY